MCDVEQNRPDHSYAEATQHGSPVSLAAGIIVQTFRQHESDIRAPSHFFTHKTQNRSERLALPCVTKMLWDRPSFDLGHPHLKLELPRELEQLILGVEFGGALDEMSWPSGLQSLIFWRRYMVHACSGTSLLLIHALKWGL